MKKTSSVLAFCSPGPRVDLQHGTELVFFIAQHPLELHLFNGGLGIAEGGLGFFLRGFPFFIKLEQYVEVRHDFIDFFKLIGPDFQRLDVSE